MKVKLLPKVREYKKCDKVRKEKKKTENKVENITKVKEYKEKKCDKVRKTGTK